MQFGKKAAVLLLTVALATAILVIAVLFFPLDPAQLEIEDKTALGVHSTQNFAPFAAASPANMECPVKNAAKNAARFCRQLEFAGVAKQLPCRWQ